jgi:putative two-component system response regulator
MAIATLPHVLVIGDRADVARSLCRTLANEPFQCTGAVGARDAVEAVRTPGIHVALVDVSNTSSRGLGLARRLRTETQDLGVVVLTDGHSLEDLAEALCIGAVDCLAKPVGSGELAAAVTRAVEWHLAARSESALDRMMEDMSTSAARLTAVLREDASTTVEAFDQCLAGLYGRRTAALAHARRVSTLAGLVARSMGIAPPLLDHVERAALVHDIGKLAIPASLLAKRGAFTAGELALVRSHLGVACAALRATPYLAPAASIVGALRERVDGRGYPRGLRGPAIPLGARIVAVAEALDTLGLGRQDGTTVPLDRINTELADAAASRFDPEVVRAWLQLSGGRARTGAQS